MARVTGVGNLVHDPSMKFANSGTAICEVTVADNYKRNRDAEEEVTYIDVVLFGSLAENIADSLHKGDRVIFDGRLQQQNWETKEGDKRSKLKVIADNFGPDLRFHVANVTKARQRGENQPTPRATSAEEFPW